MSRSETNSQRCLQADAFGRPGGRKALEQTGASGKQLEAASTGVAEKLS
ncbi:MAG: hypothetical protein ABL996_11000 [Micropepsaceae bacterium]